MMPSLRLAMASRLLCLLALAHALFIIVCVAGSGSNVIFSSVAASVDIAMSTCFLLDIALFACTHSVHRNLKWAVVAEIASFIALLATAITYVAQLWASGDDAHAVPQAALQSARMLCLLLVQSRLERLLRRAKTSVAAVKTVKNVTCDWSRRRNSWARERPRYSAFISHKKKEHGMHARYLSELLGHILDAQCFLDATDLIDLNHLFTEHLLCSETVLVVGSLETLHSPWVLIEVYVAYRRGIPVYVLALPGFDPDAAVKFLGSLEASLRAVDPGILGALREGLLGLPAELHVPVELMAESPSPTGADRDSQVSSQACGSTRRPSHLSTAEMDLAVEVDLGVRKPPKNHSPPTVDELGKILISAFQLDSVSYTPLNTLRATLSVPLPLRQFSLLPHLSARSTSSSDIIRSSSDIISVHRNESAATSPHREEEMAHHPRFGTYSDADPDKREALRGYKRLFPFSPNARDEDILLELRVIIEQMARDTCRAKLKWSDGHKGGEPVPVGRDADAADPSASVVSNQGSVAPGYTPNFKRVLQSGASILSNMSSTTRKSTRSRRFKMWSTRSTKRSERFRLFIAYDNEQPLLSREVSHMLRLALAKELDGKVTFEAANTSARDQPIDSVLASVAASEALLLLLSSEVYFRPRVLLQVYEALLTNKPVVVMHVDNYNHAEGRRLLTALSIELSSFGDGTAYHETRRLLHERGHSFRHLQSTLSRVLPNKITIPFPSSRSEQGEQYASVAGTIAQRIRMETQQSPSPPEGSTRKSQWLSSCKPSGAPEPPGEPTNQGDVGLASSGRRKRSIDTQWQNAGHATLEKVWSGKADEASSKEVAAQLSVLYHLRRGIAFSRPHSSSHVVSEAAAAASSHVGDDPDDSRV